MAGLDQRAEGAALQQCDEVQPFTLKRSLDIEKLWVDQSALCSAVGRLGVSGEVGTAVAHAA